MTFAYFDLKFIFEKSNLVLVRQSFVDCKTIDYVRSWLNKSCDYISFKNAHIDGTDKIVNLRNVLYIEIFESKES